MISRIKAIIKPFIPKGLLSFYHLALAEIAAFLYGYPSRKMVVIGVTGTKGKTSTAYILTKILEHAGYSVGLTGTAMIKIKDKECLNTYKMTMLGRFKTQKLLREMFKAGCTHVVIETSSEGILQHRHRGIAYDVAILTNLTPEHIEAHGSFAAYRAAKAELFRALRRRGLKEINKKSIPTIKVVNRCADYADEFLSFPSDKTVTYAVASDPCPSPQDGTGQVLVAENVSSTERGMRFSIKEQQYDISLPGLSSVWNSVAALSTAFVLGVSFEKSADALKQIKVVPGRFERIEAGQPFTAMVDYAHDVGSFKQMFDTVLRIPHKRIIHVFGATGGGRDSARRPKMGKVSSENADILIVTTDDPYDDDPQELNNQVIAGVAGKELGKTVFDIVDRRAAMTKAVELAQEGDLVLVSGKGCEQAMVLAGERKIPWDDRVILKEEIQKRYS